MTAEAGVDAHQTDQIKVAEDFFDGRQRRVGIEGDARLHAGLADGGQGAVQVGTGLHVHGQHRSIELGEVLDVPVRSFDHQVDVQRFLGMSANGGDDGHAVADVGHEEPVHHIDVVPIGVAAFDHVYVTAQVGEVCGEQGGGDEMGHGAKMAFSRLVAEYCSMPFSTVSPTPSTQKDRDCGASA